MSQPIVEMPEFPESSGFKERKYQSLEFIAVSSASEENCNEGIKKRSVNQIKAGATFYVENDDENEQESKRPRVIDRSVSVFAGTSSERPDEFSVEQGIQKNGGTFRAKKVIPSSENAFAGLQIINSKFSEKITNNFVKEKSSMEEFHSNVKRNETESGEIQIEGKSSEQSEKGHSKQRELKIKPRPAIHTVLKEITDNKLSARTPILTDIIADKNRFRVKVSAVSELQKFAEQVSESKHLQKDTERLAAENEKLKNLCFLKTRPIRMELNRKGGGVNRLSVDDETDGCEEKKRECEQRRDKENGEKNRVEVDVVLKVFLNGSPLVHSHSTNHDQFVSVCLSVVNTNEQHNHNDDEVTQNILEEEWLIVSVYLRQPHTDHNPYRRDFKMKFSPQLEKGEKGLLKFIEKRELEKYIAQDGSVDVGVLIQFESSAAAL